MNITIAHPLLTDMLKRLTLAKSRQWCATFTVSGGVLHAASRGDNLAVSAYASCTMPGDEGAFPKDSPPVTIPLDKLAAWLKGLHGGAVTIADDGGQTVTFTCGDATLPVWQMGDMMVAMPEEPSNKLNVPPGTWGAVKWVAYAASTDDSRPLLCQVNLQKGRVFATDSYRLAKVDVKGLDVAIGIPTSILKVLDKVDIANAKVTVDDDKRIHISDDGGRYVLSTNIGDPPNIDSIVPKNLDDHTKLTLNRKDLLDAVKHLDSVKSKGGNTPIIFHAEDGTVGLSIDTTGERAMATRTLPYEASDAVEYQFALSSGYLADTLDSLNEDQVTFNVASSLKPIVWQEDTYTALLMPVRTQ